MILDKSKVLLSFRIEIVDDMKMSLNKIWGGVHWGIRSKFRNDWHGSLDELFSGEKNPIRVPVEIEYRFYFKTRYLDTLNCSIMAKAVEDWMRGEGILKDDTNEFVRSSILTPVVVDKKVRKKMENDYLEVIIYSL